MKILTNIIFITKLKDLNWLILGVLCIIAGLGFTMLASAAGGNFSPWADRQLIRFILGLMILIMVAVTDISLWLRQAYNLYGLSLVLLLLVEISGAIGMGAQRWVDLYLIQFQPSELMKISLILALARYFHGIVPEDMRRVRCLIPPVLLILLPVLLVLRQPDLGTAILIMFTGACLIFLAGIRIWQITSLLVCLGGGVPILWSLLRDYQKERILIFLNPEQDPLGKGYHILQSKIAFGSGGIWGKGLFEGSQSYLNFLPEKQTDFIFTMLAEEMGMMGGIVLLILYTILIVYGYAISFSSRNRFGRFLAAGIATNLFLYIFINMGMVMGIVPVVGVPLPLMSYGGTAMLTVMFGLGLLMSADIHKTKRLSWSGN